MSTLTAPPAVARSQYDRFLECLDPVVTAPRLARALGLDPRLAGTVLDAKFEPGRPAVLLYRLGGQLLRATLAADETTAAPGVPVGAGLSVSRYPDDPALPGLALLADPTVLAPALQDALPATQVVDVGARLVRYRPGRRATFVLDLRVRRGGLLRHRRLVAKAYHDPAKAAAVAAEGAVLGGQVSGPDLALAPVVAHLPGPAVVLQAHLSGRVLEPDLTAYPPAPELSTATARAARALAAFHRLSVPAGRPRPAGKELRRFVSRAEGVASVAPGPGQVLLDLAHRLLALGAPEGPVSLVHGDVKPAQFLVRRGPAALLDLDHCGLADPAYDVGNMAASLRQLGIRTGAHAAPAAEDLALTFVGAYLDAAAPAPEEAFVERVEHYTSIALTRKALRAFARDPLSSLPVDLAAEAARVLDTLRGDHR
ncbi:MAG TPA: phosphotransferase [Ornithinicoccus sp.]|jgi:aminoglycoside phosphotransferase (APT) family kinase protein|nr:phosphotransferase [Ornithinicoccus sp.]